MYSKQKYKCSDATFAPLRQLRQYAVEMRNISCVFPENKFLCLPISRRLLLYTNQDLVKL